VSRGWGYDPTTGRKIGVWFGSELGELYRCGRCRIFWAPAGMAQNLSYCRHCLRRMSYPEPLSSRMPALPLRELIERMEVRLSGAWVEMIKTAELIRWAEHDEPGGPMPDVLGDRSLPYEATSWRTEDLTAWPLDRPRLDPAARPEAMWRGLWMDPRGGLGPVFPLEGDGELLAGVPAPPPPALKLPSSRAPIKHLQRTEEDKPHWEYFGAQLRGVRELSGAGGREVSDALRIAPDSYASMERGRMRPVTVLQLITSMGWDLAEVLALWRLESL